MWNLQKALNEAHTQDVIVYDMKNFTAEAPCHSLDELKNRVRATTEKALAQAMREELLSELKGAW